MRITTLVLLLVSAPAGRALAAFEPLGAGARAPGLGNAFTAVADDVYTVYYNPAGLATLSRPQLGTSYSKLFTGLKDGSDLNDQFLGYAHPISGGRHGTVAMAWNAFTLNNSLYREHQYYLSYGRLLAGGVAGGDLYGGASLKYLSRSFGILPETSNAIAAGGIARTGLLDDVLKNRSRGALDADLGLLYRMGPHYSVGLAAAHFPQPNVAFSSKDKDRVPVSLSLAVNYRSLMSNLVAQVDSRRAPGGAPDHVFTVGAERWFPRLFIGEFGARGGIGVGTRDYRQLSLGISFRTKRLQVDYGFLLPINTVEKTAGSHKMAMSVRFGRLSDEEESLEMVLEAMRQLKYGAMPERMAVEAKGLSKGQQMLLEEYMLKVRQSVSSAKYREALDNMGKALTVAPADKELVARFGRLNFVGQQIHSLPQFNSDPMQATLHQGLIAYIAGNDLEAVAKLSEALSLKPDYRELDVFLEQLELVTGIKRLKAPGQPKDYALAVLLTRAATAIEEKNYSEAVSLSLAVLEKEPSNAQALENLGTAYFALQDYDKSYEAWSKALELRQNPQIRKAIKGYLRSIRRAQESRGAQLARERPASLPTLSSEEIEKLYNQGVDLYISRDLEKARAVFERILESDPNHVEAAKALRRVKEELPLK